MKKVGFLLIGFFFDAACAAGGPDYKKIYPSVPSSFGSLEKGISKEETTDPKLLTSWWKILNDPVLNDLIEKALQRNLDVRMAQARVQQVWALRGISESSLLP